MADIYLVNSTVSICPVMLQPDELPLGRFGSKSTHTAFPVLRPSGLRHSAKVKRLWPNV